MGLCNPWSAECYIYQSGDFSPQMKFHVENSALGSIFVPDKGTCSLGDGMGLLSTAAPDSDAFPILYLFSILMLTRTHSFTMKPHSIRDKISWQIRMNAFIGYFLKQKKNLLHVFLFGNNLYIIIAELEWKSNQGWVIFGQEKIAKTIVWLRMLSIFIISKQRRGHQFSGDAPLLRW